MTKISNIYLYTLIAAILLLGSGSLSAQNEEQSNIELGYSLQNVLRHDRVNGFSAGGDLTLRHLSKPELRYFFGAGYSFALERGWYRVATEYAFDFLRYKTITLEAFDRSTTDDNHIMSTMENSFTTAFAKQDYLDFYHEKGFSVGLNFKRSVNLNISFDASYRKLSSLSMNSDWSLFNKSEIYRINPLIDEGNELKFSAGISFSNREEMYVDANYWEVSALIEKEILDYTFAGFSGSIKRIQLGPGNQTLISSITGKIRSSTLSEQYLLKLGGLGTVRGYELKSFGGNAMLLFNSEYRFNGDIIRKLPLSKIPVLSSLASALFFESGIVNFIEDKSFSFYPETGSGFSDFISSAGVSLYIMNSFIRFDLARRLDRGYEPWSLSARLVWGK